MLTEKMAREIIEQNKDNTTFFDKGKKRELNNNFFGYDTTSYEAYYDTFRNICKLGEAETKVIIAALKLAGATVTGRIKK